MCINISKAAQPIVWNDTIPLQWSDYIGKVPISTMAATTGCHIRFEMSCKNDIAKYNIMAVMLPENSWVKIDVATDELLEHERLHFAICELYARKIRATIAGKKIKCSEVKKYELIIKDLLKEMNLLQQAYDKDTNHGIDFTKHEAWHNKIHQELELLVAYKS